jgi:hypothetical protein
MQEIKKKTSYSGFAKKAAFRAQMAWIAGQGFTAPAPSIEMGPDSLRFRGVSEFLPCKCTAPSKCILTALTKTGPAD